MHTVRIRAIHVAIALLAVLAIAGAVAYSRLPDIDALLLKPATPSILIADRHGRVLYETIDPMGSKHVPLALSEIPRACQQATIATEDERFYSHPGVDLLSIARAAWTNWRAGEIVSGASTLTQQLARNLMLPEGERYEQSLSRKLREAWLAWRLEQRYTKDELLARYLNTTYYGHFATGIEAAAQAYFGVHAGELDLSQCALLAGLPQWPAGYNPIENPDAARRRQATVLRLMVAQGAITETQAQQGGDEALRFASTAFPIDAPHFVMFVQGQLENILPPERIAAGGLRVTTTLDLDWQRAAEGAIDRRIRQLTPCASAEQPLPGVTCDVTADPSRRIENAALVGMDPRTGAILTMVGSPDYFDLRTSGAVNAALSQRQPGSAIKPLTYALAMDPDAARRAGRAAWTPATVIPDIRTVFTTEEGAPYAPNNYDRRYHGPVTLRAALANSYNIPAVRALDRVGVDSLISLARDLGIAWQPAAGVDAATSPEEDGEPRESRYGLSLTLGGGEVRLIDLAAAYAALANGGSRVVPYAIERIETLEGEALWPVPDAAGDGISATPPPPARVIDERVAFLLTDILSDDLARRPAFGQGSPLHIGRPAAAKTGTTTDWRDNWTIGYTPDLVAGVWVGNADNTPMKDVSGVTGAAPIWHDFMTSVLRGRAASEFAVPSGVTQIEVCADSGLLPGAVAAGDQAASCPSRRLEWFIEGTEPTEVDRDHALAWVDPATGRVSAERVPGAYPQTFWVLGPEYQAWARENDFPQPFSVTGTMPPAQAVDRAGAGAALRLTSPDPNRRLRIDAQLPRSAQQLPVTALATFPTAGDITLTVDGVPFATVSAPDYTAWWPLAPGQHVFAAFARRLDGSLEYSAEVAVVIEP